MRVSKKKKIKKKIKELIYLFFIQIAVMSCYNSCPVSK